MGRQKNLSQGLLSGITRLAEWCQTVMPRDRFFHLSFTPIIDSIFFYIPFTSESGFLIMQSLGLQRRPPYSDDNTMAFSDIITFSDVKLNHSVPWHPIQPVYSKHMKILDFYFPTRWIWVCEIRFASTDVICGNLYPVCKKISACWSDICGLWT